MAQRKTTGAKTRDKYYGSAKGQHRGGRGSRRAYKRRRSRWPLVLLALLVLIGATLALRNCDVKDLSYPKPYSRTVANVAQEYALAENLIYAVMKAESNFNEEAGSKAGAQGLMQLMPETARWTANKMGIEYEEERLREAEYNIRLGAFYLKRLLDYYDGAVYKALAAYNAGEGNVNKWLEEGTWDGTLANAEAIPFSETRSYLTIVQGYYEKYNELYPE